MSAVKVRVNPPIARANRENAVGIRGKPAFQTIGNEARRAFGDLGNKQSSQPTAVRKTTQITIKLSQAPIKKPSAVLDKKKADASDHNKTVLSRVATLDISLANKSAKQLEYFRRLDLCSDPQLVSEYVNDIYEYLRELEEKYSIKREYLTGHRSTPRIRQILVNWLVDAHESFKMYLETLHVTIAILDRFLQVQKDVGKETLQLVGATALYIAAKYEEIYAPELSDIEYICDYAFTKKQILQMEAKILTVLKFELGRPLSIQFLRRFNRVCRATQEHHSLGKYLLELSLLNYEICHVPPSLQAAAACCLANGILGGNSNPSQGWSDTLVHFSKYNYEDIKGVVVKMACMLGSVEVSKQQVVRDKYSKSKFDKISLHSKLRCSLVRKLTAQSTTLSMK